MKAAVKSVQPTGTYPSEFGVLQNDESQPNYGKKLMHKFEITIGEHTGEYATNKYLDPSAQDFPFVVGVETDYEFVDGQYPKIKLPKKDFNPSNASKGDPKVQGMIVKQNALGHATELLKHNAIMDNGKFLSKDVMALAQVYTDWVMDAPKEQTQTEQLMDDTQN